jgi:hypothetical protein
MKHLLLTLILLVIMGGSGLPTITITLPVAGITIGGEGE